MSASTVANISLYTMTVSIHAAVALKQLIKRHACKVGVNMKVLGQKDAVARTGDG